MRWVLTVAVLLAGCAPSSDVSRQVGARCETRADCSDRCLPPADYPGGFCTLSCETESDCPDGASCVNIEGGVCLFTCSDDSECEFLDPAYSCEDRELRSDTTMQVKVCDGD